MGNYVTFKNYTQKKPLNHFIHFMSNHFSLTVKIYIALGMVTLYLNWGGVCHKGGLSQQPIIVKPHPGSLTIGKLLWYAPWGVPQSGVNENFTLVVHRKNKSKSCLS